MSATSIIELHPLAIQEDADGWLMGRLPEGAFVQVPVEAVTIVEELRQGRTIASAEESVRRKHGSHVDVAQFVDTLIDLGFVSHVDGLGFGVPLTRENLAWLRPDHLRWLFNPVAYAVLLSYLVAGLVMGLSYGTLKIDFRAYFVSEWQGINLALNLAMFVAAIAVHEFAHLIAARAAGVAGRIGLGTRLQFLVAQTTVTGLWVRPRAVRLRVYLAGIAIDLLLVATCQWALTVGGITGFAGMCLRALSVGLLVAVGTQFALYMRTDVYFVLQELLRCKNLHADAVAYAKHRYRRALRRESTDPSLNVPRRERRPVRIYTIVMLLGSAVSLTIYVGYSLPVLFTAMLKAVIEVQVGFASREWFRLGDGLLVIAIHVALQLTFLRLFLAKHRLGTSGRARDIPSKRAISVVGAR